MTEIKIVNENTNLDECSISRIEWDFIYDETPYQIVRINEYYHTIGGRYGDNDLYAYPMNEKMNVDNLIQFDGSAPTWGVVFDEVNRYKYKWNQESFQRSASCWITRNGEKFYECFGRDMGFALAKAQYNLVRLQEDIPVSLADRNWKNELINRKVYYKGEPGIIMDINCHNEVYIVPDGIEYFSPEPYVYEGEDDPEYEIMCWKQDYGKGLNCELLSSSIGWFRQ